LLYINIYLNVGVTFCFRTLKIEAANPYETLLSTNGTTRSQHCRRLNVGESECKQQTCTYTVTCIKERKVAEQTIYTV
jgi:hypothetical protein